MEKISNLRRAIAQKEAELAELRQQLLIAEKEEEEEEKREKTQQDAATDATATVAPEPWKWPLREEEYERYSRQMIVPNMGLQGQ